MIGAVSKIFVSVAGKIFFAFFTEKLISRLVLEIMRILARKTTNTLDDMMVEEVAANLNTAD